MSKKDKIALLENELKQYDSFTPQEVVNISASEKQVRCFHPEIAHLFGNNYTARDTALFLCQVKHFWDLKKRNPFHKYSSPCSASAPGDSWEEELSMSTHDLRSIKNIVTTKVRNAQQALELVTNGTEINTLVVYFKNSDRVTFWYFNEVLYAKLRALGLKKLAEKSGANCATDMWAQVRESHVGPSAGESFGIYTEPLTEPLQNIEEKESTKEKEENFDSLFQEQAKDLKKKPASLKKRESNKSKTTKPLTLQQQAIIRDQKNGVTVPLDFLVGGGIMKQLVEAGYQEAQLVEESKNMVNWFLINAPDVKKADWELYFQTKWVPKSQTLEKNGQILNKTANAERAERLGELAKSSVFERVGTTNLSELANRLRGRGT